MPTTTRGALRYPLLADTPDIPRDIQNLASDVDTLFVIFGQGTFAARPVSTPGSPGKSGRVFYATDTGHFYYDYGTGWTDIGPTAAGISPDSITATEIAANAVTASELADNAVDTGAIVAGAVTGAKINDALKPSVSAGAATESLRALGTAAGLAAAGTHASQHSRTGADPLAISTFISSGTFAARPSTSLVAGMVYTATDVGGGTSYTYNGAAWVPMAGGAGEEYGTSLPATGNFNGRKYTLIVTNPAGGKVAYQFLYAADQDATHPWLCIGGGRLSGTTTLTVPRAGYYHIAIGHQGGFRDVNISTNMELTAGGITLKANGGAGNTSGVVVSFHDEDVTTAALAAGAVLTPTVTGQAATRPYIHLTPIRVA